MNALALAPSAFTQLSLTASTAAPTKPLDGEMASAEGSLVATVQVPLASSVPVLRLQPSGIPAIVTAIGLPPAGSLNARLIGLPATPAGAAATTVPLTL